MHCIRYHSGSQHNVCAVYVVKHTVSGVTTSVLYAHVAILYSFRHAEVAGEYLQDVE